jgi:hypothetical protein
LSARVWDETGPALDVSDTTLDCHWADAVAMRSFGLGGNRVCAVHRFDVEKGENFELQPTMTLVIPLLNMLFDDSAS